MNVTVHSAGNGSLPYDFIIHGNGAEDEVGIARGTTNQPLVFAVPDPELWTPDSPTLYNVTIRMRNDTVATYMGFRTISQGIIDGIPRPLLNGEFVFQFSTLDQGYWPDGIYTAPSVEAMQFDLKLLKDTGFNMVRKHVSAAYGLFCSIHSNIRCR